MKGTGRCFNASGSHAESCRRRLRESVQSTGNHVRDMSRERGMGFGGIGLLRDDAGGGGFEAKKPRFQTGRNKELVKPERKVSVVGHRDRGARLLEDDRHGQ